MNLKDPLWSSFIATAPNSSAIINSTGFSNLSASSLIFPGDTGTLLSATTNSGSHLWDFKSYWYLTVPITVATIVLPLIAGKIFRMTLQSFYRYQFYWRASLVICFLAVLIVINIEIPPLIGFGFYIFVFGIIQGGVAFVGLTWASIAGKRQIIWVGFSTIVVLSFSINLGLLFVSETFRLTGFLPLIFLFMTWTRDDSLALIRIAFQHLRVLIPSRIFDSLRGVLKAARLHLGWFQFMLAICSIALFLALHVTTPKGTYIGLVSGSFGPLAYNRLLRSLTRRDRNYWIAFSIVVATSTILDWWTRSGSGGYLPITYLYCGWIRDGLISFTKKQLRRLSKLSG